MWFGYDNNTGTGNTAAETLSAASVSSHRHRRVRHPAPGQPFGDFRFWDFDGFAQDRWKLKPNLTLNYGVRFGYWTNNRELNGLGGWFDPAPYDRRGPVPRPRHVPQVNGVCYVSSGYAPTGILANRGPFALPRVNLAWDIDGQPNNVLRGGYGIFFNRNMGDVKYGKTLRLAPAPTRWRPTSRQAAYGDGVGLTYDTMPEATLARVGTLAINSCSAQPELAEDAQLFVGLQRRILLNQVVEGSYVGTRGRNLFSRINGNAVPEGALDSGTLKASTCRTSSTATRGRHGELARSGRSTRCGSGTAAAATSRCASTVPGPSNYARSR